MNYQYSVLLIHKLFLYLRDINGKPSCGTLAKTVAYTALT